MSRIGNQLGGVARLLQLGKSCASSFFSIKNFKVSSGNRADFCAYLYLCQGVMS